MYACKFKEYCEIKKSRWAEVVVLIIRRDVATMDRRYCHQSPEAVVQ